MRWEIFDIRFYVFCMTRKRCVCVFWGNGGSIWWRNSRNIKEGIKLVHGGWLFDNINWRIGDGSYTLFWINHWLDGTSLNVRFSRQFDLVKNKRVTIVEMNELKGKNSESWKWLRRLFAWEKELVGECIEQLMLVI